MALAELGGLGGNEGPPLNYHWAPPSRIPPLLPWLAILLLMASRPNRCLQAWWLLVPLSFLAGLASLFQLCSDSLPSSGFSECFDLVVALAFGVAAVWLLSPWLRRSHRVLTFFLMLLVSIGFGALALFARRGLDADVEQGLAEGASVLAASFALSLALSLAGLLCRRRYSRLRLSLWLLLFTLASWSLVLGPFFIIIAVTNQGGPTAWQFLLVVLAVTGVTFGTLLPFLGLSFCNRFYHERLMTLLHAGQMAAPPVIGPLAPTAVTATN